MEQSINSNRLVTSVLARCTADPTFMKEIICNPKDALKTYDLSEPLLTELIHFDFRKVLQFAGFVTKVKNNQTWMHFSKTRSLMKLFEIEFDFFVYYFPHFSSYLKGNPDPQSRAIHFCQHLKSFLRNADTIWSRLILSMHEHTEIVLQLEGLSRTSHNEIGESTNKIDLEFIPRLREGVILNHFVYDPLDILEFSDDRPKLEELLQGDHWLLYQFKSGKLEITKQGQFVSLLISLANGRASISGIQKKFYRVTGQQISNQQITSFYSELKNEFIVA